MRFVLSSLLTTCLLASVGLLLGGCGSDERLSDRSTPKAAVLALLDAIKRRDVEQVKACFSKDADPAYVAALVRLTTASAKLNAGVTEAIDADRARELDPSLDPLANNRAAIEQARESTENGLTLLTTADGQRTALKQEGGNWGIVWDSAGPVQPDPARSAAGLNAIAKAIETVTENIPKGTYKDPDKDKHLRNIRAALTAERSKAIEPTK